MTTLLFPLALVVLTVALILLIIAVKCVACEIDELKEKLEHHRIKLKYLDDYTLPDYKRRLDQLEEVLELKEYFDEEPLNEEENIND